MTATLTDMPSRREAEIATSNPDYLIGEGCDREVYHIPGSRWVYKSLMKHGQDMANTYELQKYNELKGNLPKGMAIPEVVYIDSQTIACEYVGGKHPDSDCYIGWHCPECVNPATCWIRYFDTLPKTPITDIHSFNVKITEDGTYWLIDLGEPDENQF